MNQLPGTTASQSDAILVCMTDDCPERFRGFTTLEREDWDDAWGQMFCGCCKDNLSPIDNPEGLTLDEFKTQAARMPRPLSEEPLANGQPCLECGRPFTRRSTGCGTHDMAGANG